jgi:hypothetical protein
MAENEPKMPPAETGTGKTQPAKPMYGPGVLMVIGLGLLVIAAWCGHDYFNPKEEWVKGGHTGTIYMQFAGMVAFGAAAIYSFVLAAVRSKKPAAGPPPEA